VRILRLEPLRPRLRDRLRQAQWEAARVWMRCRDRHLQARQQGLPWPHRDDLQQATNGGQFALHSQTVQMICHSFLANVKTTAELKARDPKRYRKMRYPYKDKRFYPLSWPAQTVCIERGRKPDDEQKSEGGTKAPHHGGRILLPMGRGRPPLIFPLDTTTLPEQVGGCQLVWKDGYELHLSVPVAGAAPSSAPVQAAVDLGEIHQAAVSTNTGRAILISGWGAQPSHRTPSPPTDEPVGVWQRHPLSQGESHPRRHHELHWQRTGNEQPVSSMPAVSEDAQRARVGLSPPRVWLCRPPRCGGQCEMDVVLGSWQINCWDGPRDPRGWSRTARVAKKLIPFSGIESVTR
jgi:hypothetical protein